VDVKKPDPEWTDPSTGKVIPAGEAGNELGTRWIGFGGALGIHGVPDPATIGTYTSRGCIGLVREDAEELYDVIMTGTPIKVTGTINARMIAAEEPATPMPGTTF
jgi:lipoprotein-anchoring transpeptidase ErfK/SrfK